MWTCSKCRQSNDDRSTICAHCGAARSAGRFSQGVQPRQTPMAQYTPSGSPSRAGTGYMLFGALLTVLIPVALLLLSIFTRKHWIQELYLAMNPSASGIPLDDFKTNLIYWCASAVCMLAATLPGLWTIGIGKALRRLARVEDRL